MCVGVYRAESVRVVHDLYEGLVGVEPLVTGVGGDWWAVKFARREEVSSVFDFSKKGRLVTEGPPDMMFEVDSMSFMAAVVMIPYAETRGSGLQGLIM